MQSETEGSPVKADEGHDESEKIQCLPGHIPGCQQDACVELRCLWRE